MKITIELENYLFNIDYLDDGTIRATSEVFKDDGWLGIFTAAFTLRPNHVDFGTYEQAINYCLMEMRKFMYLRCECPDENTCGLDEYIALTKAAQL